MAHSYQLGLYEKAMPGTLTFKEKLEAVKSAGFKADFANKNEYSS
jgi:L-ribulose-5-phosphate 3-epimerase UlaE